MLAALLALASLVQFGIPNLQPRTYTSPWGEWTCHVDPSSLRGPPTPTATNPPVHPAARATSRRAWRNGYS